MTNSLFSKTLHVLTLVLLCHLTTVSPQNVVQINLNQTSPGQISLNQNVTQINQAKDQTPISDELKKFQEFKKSSFYLPPFEDGLLSLPDVQRELVINTIERNFELFRTIMREAIDKRHSFAPSVSLMWKYSGKLIKTFIRDRLTESRLEPRKEPDPALFEMVAKLIENVINNSTEIKKQKNYTKDNVDVENLYHRFDAILQYIQRIIEASPLAAYLRWDKMVLFKNDKDTPLVPETSDLTAMFRGIGYDKCMFVGRRLVNLLHLFSKGRIPSENEV